MTSTTKRIAGHGLRAMLLAGGLALATSGAATAADTTVVIVRHGEKPAQGLGQLTCQGLNRALALAPLLLARYGAPAAIYAPNPAQLKTDSGVAYPYIRPLATIEPLAVRQGLPVNIQWGMDQTQPLADKLLAAASTGTQVVAWEHHWGETLARQLLKGANADSAQVPKWQDDDFDSVYVVRLQRDDQGAVRGASFSREPQGLDGQPAQCSDGPGRGKP
jgi:hypothetical protein